LGVVDGAPESYIFTTISKFGKRIRLTKTRWLSKTLKDHPEFSARKEYLSVFTWQRDLAPFW